MLILKKFLFYTCAGLIICMAEPTQAGIMDPWYLLYKVKGGDIIHTKGPYSSKIACQGSKWSLSLS